MISASQIEDIGRYASAQPLSEQMLSALRQQFPEVHFSYCMDDDVIGATPALEGEGFNLYLVDSSNHCFALTTDPDVASGVVVAELDND
jgi:hypothetical protein